jgi:tetratricopeptide (TPR) repeat protein
MIRSLLSEDSGAAVLATALCLWALYAQQHYRVAAGTPEWAIAWAGVALAVVAASLTVRGWIERRLAPSHEAVVAVDRAASVALWLVRLYVLWSVVLLANAVLDGSSATTRRATIGTLSRGEAYFASFVPLAWADLVFTDSREHRRVLLDAREAEVLWGGQAVEVRLHAGALGLARIAAVAPDEEVRHRAVLAIAPDAAGSWAALARLYAKRERWPEAMEAARSYLRASADSGTVRDLAAERFQRGDYARAAEFARLVFDRERSFKSHTFLGWTLSKMGQHKEALPLLRTAVELDPETFWGYYHLGYAYKYAGQPAEAAAMFHEVLKRRPDYPEIERELRSMGR